ncbi:VENN motif pre-toxin domain-containing protein [Yersinia massiliensis]|uniref:VENN motif-containing domain-containing protein n=1 Tax=Yersinia massiliensis TaxID=419257 RepID=A0ABM6UP82_9GAMM|nr:VENN motif pre-toxin domain-containing protein [Yersinia massiliensis]AVX36790.1 hypothetical protein DA391_03395 [Yersinia massiliensis]QKJ11591.1 VENN motif pre-toxin domain-containing protein [Yersinia massiliensis]
MAGGSTADTVAGAQAGKNAVENNALLLLMAPPPSVAGQVPQSGANTVIAQKLDDAVKEFGREAVKQCLSGGDCPLPVQVALLAIQAMMGQGENGPNPNIGKDLTDEQKKELGGSGAGTPGGWGPQDEESARNKEQQSITVEDLTSTSSKGNETTGRSKLFERTGGSSIANKEFDALSPTDIKNILGGRVGKLPDRRTVIVRECSTNG